MNILVVAPDFPFPPNHGGRADIWKRVELYRSQGHIVDLLCTFSREDVSDDDLAYVCTVVRNVHFVARNHSWRMAIGFKPFQVKSREALRRFKSAHQYEVVVFESEFVADAIKAFGDTGARKVLRIHNNESNYFWGMFSAATKFHHKIYYLVEAIRFRFYSPMVKRSCDVVLHISHDEFDADLRGEFREKVIFFPPHVATAEFVRPTRVPGPSALFVGNLFTENNVAGLKWYLDEVHPRVRAEVPGYKLVVAGNSRGNPPRFLQEHDDSVVFHESPASLRAIYASSRVFVNPMLSGAGVKLKTVHAMEKGLPVVSTTIGVEGMGVKNEEHYLLGDTPENFADAVIALLRNEDMGMALASSAQHYLAEHFDNSRKMDSVFSGPPSRHPA